MKGMTTAQYKDYILTQLGVEIIDIELDTSIDKFISLALLKLKPCIGSSELMTIPVSDCTDLSDKHIHVITAVYRGSPSIGTNILSAHQEGDDYLFNPAMVNLVNLDGMMNGSIDSIVITQLVTNLVNQANGTGPEIDFDFDSNGILYVDTTNMGCSRMTIEYIPDFQDVSEVKDPFYINKILEYALALTKIALGRARGKYRVTNLSYELDSDTLISEGKSEVEQLNQWISENNDIFYVHD